jgi:hypothetical protein
LDEKPAALYQIKEVYPREGTDLGVYRYGEEFLYDMPKGSAVVLELNPAKPGETSSGEAFDPKIPASRVQVVRAFNEELLPRRSSCGCPRRNAPADRLVRLGEDGQ